jgi:hypothetical protein
MTDASDWVYCRLVDRGMFIFPRMPYWLGQVEFSEPPPSDSAHGAALKQSMAAFGVAESGEGWQRLVRARILMPNVSAADAQKYGEFHLTEAVQSFNSHLSMGFGGLRPTLAGYLDNIRTRGVTALSPPWNRDVLAGCSAMLDEVAVHPAHVLNHLYVAPLAFGELGDAFRRSSHWRELATQTEDKGESLLLFWMAAECLCKQTHDEEIRSKLLAACGFPTGRLSDALGHAIARELTIIAGYRQWRGELMGLFDALRNARNRIVHSGYRHVDLPALFGKKRPEQAVLALQLATKCLGDMALQGINVGKRSIGEMWQHYPGLISSNGLVRHATWIIDRLNAGPA